METIDLENKTNNNHCLKMGKICYETKEYAGYAKAIADYDYPKNKHRIYVCEYCGYYHLTTKK